MIKIYTGRREEERRLSELRRLREHEYEAERLRLQARLEEEEEQRDPESLANRLRDFEGDEKDDQGLEGPNAQSTSYQEDTRSPMCNTIHTTERGNVEEKENLNVSWVQRLCSGEGDLVKKEEVKSVISLSLPKLGVPRFDGNSLEWPTFISLFKCFVHDEPLTDTQRMTHLQRALDGNAKKAIGGMDACPPPLVREALKELD